MSASRFVQPMAYTGTYPNEWAGYVFKENLGYTSGRHTGVDYNYGNGDEDKGYRVYSISEGTVRYAGNPGVSGFGNVVIVEHPLHPQLQAELGTPSLFSRYMHLNTIDCSVGQNVGVEQQIATCGDTGTDWAHLHLDLYKANLGVHFQYHKDTEMASYLDAFYFIESHNKEIGGDVPMTPQQEEEAYQIVLGRPMEHGGSGRTGYKFIIDAKGELDNQRSAINQMTSALNQKIAEMNNIINNLSARPTNQEYALAQAQLAEKVTEIEAAKRALEEERAKVKEVPVYTHDEETKQNVSNTLKLATDIWSYFYTRYATFRDSLKK